MKLSAFHSSRVGQSIGRHCCFAIAFAALLHNPFDMAPFAVEQARADAPPMYELNSGWVKSTLLKMTNKKVTLRLVSGEELTGTVLHVGDEATQIGGLTGRDFYDALIRLDQIAAIIFNARAAQ